MANYFSRKREAKDRFRRIGENLMNLEVNTIVTPRLMTARKTPSPPHALLDIANIFQRKLTASSPTGLALKAKVLRPVTEDERAETAEKGRFPRPQVEAQTFRELYETAKLALESDGDFSASEETVLQRIRRSSVEIAAMLEKLPAGKEGWAFGKTRSDLNSQALESKGTDLAISDADWLQIRKIWEVGVEDVTMQTIIQLDGDVITRIQQDYATERHARLWQAHREGTQVAMDSWRFLVETVGRFVSAAVRFFGGR